MLGYLYQCKYALLIALQRCRQLGNVRVELETLDDVSIQTDGNPAEALQFKHSLTSRADLTDSSPQIWKTLRAWMSNRQQRLLLDDTILTLVTTSVAPEGCAAHFLKAHSHNTGKAVELLTKVAERSRAEKGNRETYDAFLSLSLAKRHELLDQVLILDGQPNISEIETDLEAEVRFSRPSRSRSVAGQLEEWWYARCVRQLTGQAGPILAEEMFAEIEQIVDSLRDDDLPIYRTYDKPDPSKFEDERFVAQLRLIQMTSGGILQAVKDYFRAFTLRSRWQREELINIGELGQYEDRLVEQWHMRFRYMTEELGEDAAEEAKVAAARELYKWVELEADEWIRPRCLDTVVTRGTYQILANGLRVGWHIDFESRLASLLESAPAK